MEKSYKIFTIYGPIIGDGGWVTVYTLKDKKGHKSTVFSVGKKVHNGTFAFIHVALLKEAYHEFKQNGTTCVCFAKIGKTKSGNDLKLFQTNGENISRDKAIIIVSPLDDLIKSYTGDRDPFFSLHNQKFLIFPGQILKSGKIPYKEGDKIYYDHPRIFTIEKNQIFCIEYANYFTNNIYYWFDGEKLIGLSWDERLIYDSL